MAEASSEHSAPSFLTIALIVGVGLVLAIGVVFFLVVPITIPLTTQSTTGPSSNITVAHITILAGAASNQHSPGYSPDIAVVIIGVNNTVQWTNDDTATHTVTGANGTFDSGDIAQGQSWTYNFTKPGVYNYTCIYHSWMHGTIIVKQGVQGVTVLIPNGAGIPPTPWNQSHLVSSLYYNPPIIKVVIGVNNTVTWKNIDTAAHTVTDVNGSFDSGNIAPGATWSYTFNVPGVYEYYCTYHLWMGGEVIVLPSTNSSSQGG
ncbi:MAG: cupredoxin domain-containing protein [Conexivisphaerales archaeon]